MRKRKKNKQFSVHVIAGTEVVLLGLNATKSAVKGLLGFAIHREDYKGKKEWLKGYQKFEDTKTNDSSKGKQTDSLEAPIQRFLWGDYRVDPARTYTYTIVPIYGKPGKLKQGKSVRIKITTESDKDRKHSVFFNRGVAGSISYNNQFNNHRKWYPVEKYGSIEKNENIKWSDFIKPGDVPEKKAWKWLSRGLEEAILKFIAQANGPDYAIRASLYELTYLPALEALAAALESGADVKIIHHAKFRAKTEIKKGKQVKVKYLDDVTEAAKAAIRQVGIKEKKNTKRWKDAFIERSKAKISHNKFVILLKKGKPIQVWTGSTNLTAGGIFGQSNVGHVIRDETVAAQYLEYWQKLSTDPKKKSSKNDPPDEGIRNWIVNRQPDLTDLPTKHTVTPIFSPRLTTGMLQWYADRLGVAKSSIHFTAAFGVSQEIGKKLVEQGSKAKNKSYLSYILLEKKPGKKTPDTKKKKAKDKGKPIPVDYYDFIKLPVNRIAYGDVLKNIFREECLSGLNTYVDYLHTKYLLIDPLTDNPTVISGSANFSKPSTIDNDENMLIIQGNTRVADIFLTEFMRLFNHFHNRNSASKTKSKPHLTPDDTWTKLYYKVGTQEQKERLLFA